MTYNILWRFLIDTKSSVIPDWDKTLSALSAFVEPVFVYYVFSC